MHKGGERVLPAAWAVGGRTEKRIHLGRSSVRAPVVVEVNADTYLREDVHHIMASTAAAAAACRGDGVDSGRSTGR